MARRSDTDTDTYTDADTDSDANADTDSDSGTRCKRERSRDQGEQRPRTGRCDRHSIPAPLRTDGNDDDGRQRQLLVHKRRNRFHIPRNSVGEPIYVLTDVSGCTCKR